MNPESIFDRWRLQADHMWRDPEIRKQFEREYTEWYENKFKVSPQHNNMPAFFNLWVTYQIGLEDGKKER